MKLKNRTKIEQLYKKKKKDYRNMNKLYLIILVFIFVPRKYTMIGLIGRYINC